MRAGARALRLDARDPRAPRRDTSKLRGENADTWAFAFGFHAQVIFEWDGNHVILLDVGSDDEVYG